MLNWHQKNANSEMVLRFQQAAKTNRSDTNQTNTNIRQYFTLDCFASLSHMRLSCPNCVCRNAIAHMLFNHLDALVNQNQISNIITC